jgi:hypothetical protein
MTENKEQGNSKLGDALQGQITPLNSEAGLGAVHLNPHLQHNIICR